jgi:hypothetical protein
MATAATAFAAFNRYTFHIARTNEKSRDKRRNEYTDQKSGFTD